MGDMDTEVDKANNLNISQKKYSSSHYVLKSICIWLMLLAPFIMGLHITTLSNDKVIKEKIAKQLGWSSNKSLQQAAAKEENIPKWLWAFGGLYPFGGIFGAFFADKLNKSLGRRGAITVYVLVTLIGCVLKLASFWSHCALLFIGRFADGIASAGIMATTLVFMYEWADNNTAKFLKPLVQTTINFGLFVCAACGHTKMFGGQYFWLFVLPGVAGLILLIAVWSLPESPIWLHTCRSETACNEAIRCVHNKSYEEVHTKVKSEVERNKNIGEELKLPQLFKNASLRRPLIAAILMNCAQQLSGVNGIVAFSAVLFSKAGVDDSETFSLYVILAGLIGSIIFAPVVSRFMRKRNLVISHALLAVCLTGFLILKYTNQAKATLGFLMAFLFIFQLGPGPILWFITMEVFPPNAFSAANSICVTFNWLANTIVFAITNIGVEVLFAYVGVNVFITIFMILFVAETLNRSTDDIIQEYEDRFTKYHCC